MFLAYRGQNGHNLYCTCKFLLNRRWRVEQMSSFIWTFFLGGEGVIDLRAAAWEWLSDCSACAGTVTVERSTHERPPRGSATARTSAKTWRSGSLKVRRQTDGSLQQCCGPGSVLIRIDSPDPNLITRIGIRFGPAVFTKYCHQNLKKVVTVCAGRLV